MAHMQPTVLGVHLGRHKNRSLKVTNVFPSLPDRTREPQRLSPDYDRGEKDRMGGGGGRRRTEEKEEEGDRRGKEKLLSKSF